MDYKDFKFHLKDVKDKINKTVQATFVARQRNSRPRAAQNIINPKQKGI